MSTPNSLLYPLFLDICFSWKYVPKTLPILASIFTSLTHLFLLIYRPKQRLQLYDTPFPALINIASIFISFDFLGYSFNDLQLLPNSFVNSIFTDFFNSNFPQTLAIFTGGSVSRYSTDFSFFIPDLQICYSEKLQPFTSFLIKKK